MCYRWQRGVDSVNCRHKLPHASDRHERKIFSLEITESLNSPVGRDPWVSLSPTPDKTSVLNFSILCPSTTCQVTWFIILPRPAFSSRISYFHCWYGSGGSWRKEANFQLLLTFSVLVHVSVTQAFAYMWKLPFMFTKTLQIRFHMSSFEKSFNKLGNIFLSLNI